MTNPFKRKKLIISIYYPPGELVKMILIRDTKFVRVAFTNKVKIAGTWPITDIPYVHVTGIRVVPSKFEKWFFGLFGKKARGKFLVIKHHKSN